MQRSGGSTMKKNTIQSHILHVQDLVMSNIDLLIEILLRVPTKSLIRFKSVSKQWLSLISSSSFAIAHTRSNNSPVSHFLYQDKRNDDVSISLDGRSSSLFPSLSCLDSVISNSGAKPLILHSSNGLVLCALQYSPVFHTWISLFVVLNPTIQKYRLLPEQLGDRSLLMISAYTNNCFLDFEPSKSHHYRVVILDGDIYRNHHFRVYIFSSESGTWKTTGFNGPPSTSPCTRRVFWNSSIHWLGKKRSHLQFGVDTERIVENRLPTDPSVVRRDKILYFGECNGRLFLVKCHKLAAERLTLLELDKGSNYWITNHLIDLRPLALGFPGMRLELYEYSVLYVESGLDKENFNVFLAIPGKVVLCEVKKGKYHMNAKVVSEFPVSDFTLGEYRTSTHPFSQCLVPV